MLSCMLAAVCNLTVLTGPVCFARFQKRPKARLKGDRKEQPQDTKNNCGSGDAIFMSIIMPALKDKLHSWKLPTSPTTSFRWSFLDPAIWIVP